MNSMRADGIRYGRRIIDMRENIGFRIDSAERFKDPLAPAHAYKPIMHDRDFQLQLRLITLLAWP